MDTERPSNLENIAKTEKLKKVELALNNEIEALKQLVSSKRARGEQLDPEDFNLRSKLYALAFEIAPEARHQDLSHVEQWLQPKKGEIGVDVAAGTGFLDRMLAEKTQNTIYAIDPSKEQLNALSQKLSDLPVVPVEGSLSDKKTMQALGKDQDNIDYVTSFGGIHHVIDRQGAPNQRRMFENIAQILKQNGRFVGADVGANTKLSEHFDKSCTTHCLTGHEGNWLSEQRLKEELLPGTGLELVKTEVVPIKWEFDSEKEMALFMKALHAYDLTEQEVLSDLRNILGYEKQADRVALNWPMFFFNIEKKKATD